MKRLLLAALLLCCIVGMVAANTALNFQQPADFTEQAQCFGTGTGSCAWVESIVGGNSYIVVTSDGGATFFGIANAEATAMTYSAATVVDPAENSGVGLFDASKNPLWVTATGEVGGYGRLELKMQGNTAYFYRDGIEITHSGLLAQNPSFIAWGESSAPGGSVLSPVDDIVWGSSEPLTDSASDKYVYGMPETSSTGGYYYVLMKDMVNPAASGFYYGNGTAFGSLINSHHFTSTFSKGNGNNDSIALQGYTTGVNVLFNSTGTDFTGTIYWDLDSFFAANPAYGLYAMHSASSLKYSDLIAYLGNGASISWSKPTYSQGETGATITTVISSGGYWAPATYDYKVDVIDVYGTVWGSYPITTQSSTVTHTWLDDQDIGVYYAVIKATPKATGSEAIWMNYAICNIDDYLAFHGYVFNAETEAVIPNATVNMTQGDIVQNVLTSASGNYTIGNLTNGALLSMTVNATGYRTYRHSMTPLRVGTIDLNFTLIPNNPSYTGIALGGIAFEPPYNRTINNVRVDIRNTSDGLNYVATTNSVGYYLQDAIDGPSHWFDVWGSKSGYLNSTIYHKLVSGTVSGGWP